MGKIGKLVKIHQVAADALDKISNLCGPDFKLTLLCRCTRTDLEDADILITSDDLDDIKEAIQKRIDDEGL